MFRRRYLELLGVGTGGALVGQAETAENETANETAQDNTDTTSAAPTCEPEIEFGERELITDDSGFSTDAIASVVVENVGNAASGEITVTAGWLDTDGNFLDSTSERLPSLDADETWIAHVGALGPDPEDIVDFEVTGEFAVGQPRAPQGLTVVESELQVEEFSAQITGVAENSREEDLDRVEAIGKIYGDDGVVIGGNATFERDLPAGRNWNFEIRMPDRATEAADHEVLLDARTYQIQG